MRQLPERKNDVRLKNAWICNKHMTFQPIGTECPVCAVASENIKARIEEMRKAEDQSAAQARRTNWWG